MATAARDTGLFGPGSVAWDLHSHPAMLVGGLRALMIQALHPLGMAAVADHSDYKSDVWGRFDRTSGYVLNTVYGDRALAEELGARVRAVHRPIRGIDTVTRRPYSADDPVLLLWIHCTLIESFLSAYRRYVGPVPPKRADAYFIKAASLVPKATVDPKTNKIVAPPGCIEAYQQYLELDPNGAHAVEVKDVLTGFGQTVKSSYKAGKK